MMTSYPTLHGIAASAALSAAAGLLLGIVLDDTYLHRMRSSLYSAGVDRPTYREVQTSPSACPVDPWKAPTEPFEGAPGGDDPQLHLVSDPGPLAPTWSRRAEMLHTGL